MDIVVTQMLELPNEPLSPTTLIKPWADRSIARMRQLGHQVTHLVGPRDTPENLNEALQLRNPSLYVNYGHGFRDVITSQKEARFGLEVLEDGKTLAVYGPLVNKSNSNWLSNRMSYVVSCQTAAELGPDAIRKGALSYIGWAENFEFGIEGTLAAPGFEELANAGIFALLNGGSMGEAAAIIIDVANSWMKTFWDANTSISITWAALMKANRDSLRLLGDPNSRLI